MSYQLEITKALRADDLCILADSLTAISFDTLQTDQLLDTDDGYRIWELPEQGRDGLLADFVEPTGVTGYEVLVDTIETGGVASRTSFATKALAQVYLDALGPSDGYKVYADWDGLKAAKRFEKRITLWRWTPGDDPGGGPPEPIASRKNQHAGRTDEDRF